MARIDFTPRYIRTASCPKDKKRKCFSDKVCPGLVLEVRVSGGKTFYARYIDEYGSQRSYRIGNATSMTLKAARNAVIDLKSQVATGIDPMAVKREKRAVPKIIEFFETQYLPFVQEDKKSWEEDVGMFRNHIAPHIGKKRVDLIKTSDILSIHHGMKRNGYAEGTCNRVLVLMRYMFNLMVRWKIGNLAENPCSEVNLFKVDNHHQRFLSREEIVRLHEALKTSKNPFLYHIVSFLLLTGARKQEALKASWSDFDFQNGFWLIPETKSGRPRPVPLSDHLLLLLDSLPSKGASPWLFPNPKTGKPYVHIYHSWNTARTQADLADVRMHDLRHSFASFLVNAGRSLYEVQKLLGHAHISTTERYAHLSNETLTSAANAAGNFVPMSVAPTKTIDITPKHKLEPKAQTLPGVRSAR